MSNPPYTRFDNSSHPQAVGERSQSAQAGLGQEVPAVAFAQGKCGFDIGADMAGLVCHLRLPHPRAMSCHASRTATNGMSSPRRHRNAAR